MTTMLEDGDRLEEILSRVLGDDVQIVNEQSVMFACTCSKERLAGILQTLGHEELASMREEQNGAELVCHFCGEKYQFDELELQALIDHIQTTN
jgi:molecular chaperone Hsp33